MGQLLAERKVESSWSRVPDDQSTDQLAQTIRMVIRYFFSTGISATTLWNTYQQPLVVGIDSFHLTEDGINFRRLLIIANSFSSFLRAILNEREKQKYVNIFIIGNWSYGHLRDNIVI